MSSLIARVSSRSKILSWFLLPLLALSLASPGSHADSPTEGAPHRVRWLHRGLEDLEMRLRMIESAQESIELESYIFSQDKVGMALMQALVAKKRANPKIEIRVLVDYNNAAMDRSETREKGVDRWLVRTLLRERIKIRRFSDTWMLLHLETYNRRDHRKIMIVDGKQMIVGGRNIADEYFDVAPAINVAQWMDRDIWVEGPVVQEGLASFNEFFNATPPIESYPLLPSQNIAVMRYQYQLEHPTQEQKDFLFNARDLGSKQLAEGVEYDNVMNVRYVHDAFSHESSNYQNVAQALDESFAWANKLIYVENFLIMPTEKRERSYLEALSRKVKVIALTNSEVTNDASIEVKMSHRVQDSLIKEGLESYEIENRLFPKTTILDPRKPNVSNPVAIHTKTYLFLKEMPSPDAGEGELVSRVGCGSFNEDGRSSWYNFESMLFIEGDDRVTADLLADLSSRRSHALARHTGESQVLDAYQKQPWYKRWLKRALRWGGSQAARPAYDVF